MAQMFLRIVPSLIGVVIAIAAGAFCVWFGGLVAKIVCPSGWKHKLMQEIIEFSPKGGEMFLASLVALAALSALQIYKETNTLSMLESLEERDDETRQLYVTANHSEGYSATAQGIAPGASVDWQGKDLIRVFAGEPKISIPSDRECTVSAKEFIHSWAVDYFDRAAQVPLKWKSIADLHDTLWSSNYVLDERYVLARALHLHAVNYLDIVHDAYREREMGYFTAHEYDMWKAYLKDLGYSPFFLLAFEDNRKFGYMMPEVAAGFRNQMAADPKLKCTINAIYPELLHGKR
jgi:hypothetical protein